MYFSASICDQTHPISRSKNVIDCIIPPDFTDVSSPNEKQQWCTSSRVDECKPRYSFSSSIKDFKIRSHICNFFIKPKRLILITIPITLTILIGVIILNARDYISYENNYYYNLLTLPIALVIILFLIFNQTRIEYYRLNREKISISIPIPFNPFSKINRFDTMILCGIVSHEILEIIEEIFLRTTHMKLLTISGPLFDLVRQIGLIIIIGILYYRVYAVIEMSSTNILYYTLCAFYMWLDLVLRIFEQAFCVNISSVIRTWQKIQQLTVKFQTSTLATTFIPDYEDSRSGGFRGHLQRIRDRLSFRETRPTTTLITSTISVRIFSIEVVICYDAKP
jgi:hypothetical protein